MRSPRRVGQFIALAWMFGSLAWGATFGTVIPIGGHASDIALDESVGRLYIANFAAGRIDVLSTASRSLLSPIILPRLAGPPEPDTLALSPAGTLAVSPDGRCLVVGRYAAWSRSFPAVMIVNLASGSLATFDRESSPLAVAFGSDGRALLVSTDGFELVDCDGNFTPLQPRAIDSTALPVPFATFPPEILRASAGVSGNGTTTYVLIEAGPQSFLYRYSLGVPPILTEAGPPGGTNSGPELGPVVVSVDRDGSTFLAGWVLLNRDGVLLAEFPYPTGRLNLGGHAFDDSRNLIYGNVPTSAETSGAPSTLPAAGQDGPVLTIFDSDNLTVRERIRLREGLGGKALLSSDRNVMYAISDSGVTIFPIGSLAQTNRVTVVEEDVLFPSNACQNGVISKEINIVNPGGGNTDFTLSTSAPGIQISPSTGTTPARVRIDVDPTFFQSQTGTTAVTLEVRSSSAINLPIPVRLLINTRQPEQRGTIVDVPGKLVDILADPVRDRFYVLRQDKNLVLVFDGSNFAQIATLRTGNTPMQMAMTTDRKFLFVTNDHSQIANVYDLDLLQSAGFIAFPSGHYPRSIAVSNGATLVTTRVRSPHFSWKGIVPPAIPGQIDQIIGRNVIIPATLGIYSNGASEDTVLTSSPSGGSIFMAMPDGTVALYAADADTFVASRKDIDGFSGGYTALTDQLFVVDNRVLNWSLVPIAQLQSDAGSSSGISSFDGGALQTTSPSASAPGVIQRLDLSTFSPVRPIRMAESPLLSASMTTPSIGQIGQTILPFTRTLAPLSNRVSIVSLTTSGLTVLPWNFDVVQPVPSVDSIVNMADLTAGVAPGGLISIFGSNFTPNSSAASTLPLPTTLGDLCVSANGVAVPLLTVSPGRIDSQLPFGVVGNANLVVNAPGGASSPASFTSLAGAPAIFHSGMAGPLTGLPTVYRSTNNELVTLSNPVHPGDFLLFFATGLGVTTPAVESGAAAPSDPLALASLQPIVTLGGVPLPVSFAGLVPGLVGVYQINAFVPDNVPEGLQVPLAVSQGTYATTLSVRVVK